MPLCRLESPAVPGPAWGDELLTRLGRDPRYAPILVGANQWSAVPVFDESVLRHPPSPQLPRNGGRLCYQSSGSGGAPKSIFHDEWDWRDSVAHRADCLCALGIGPSDLAVVALPHGPWFSGDHLTDALLAIGAQVLPAGIHGAHLAGIGRLISRLGATALITTPTTAMALAAVGPAHRLHHLVTVGEALPIPVMERLEVAYGIPPRALFAASEAVLGYADDERPNHFHWDPERLHLEIVSEDGTIRTQGTGELLVTRRYGTATPLLRYRLGDRVVLDPDRDSRPLFRHLGRSGHAFGLATGVAVDRALLDRFLDDLGGWVGKAVFQVHHGADGHDRLVIRLEGGPPDGEPLGEEIKDRFLALSPEIADLSVCGYLDVTVEVNSREHGGGKRKVSISEGPWQL